MKNFPHQINQLPKLVRGLATFAELEAARSDLRDDGAVGKALARARVYTFRAPGTRTIHQLLAAERRKPRASQGTRTAARDLRRLFELLGFLEQEARGALRVSTLGRRLLALSTDQITSAARSTWSVALDGLRLADDDGTSHPYRILLRLARENPGLRSPFLGLCLEAKDDSEEEFERVLRHSRQTDADAMWRGLGVSEHMARNAIKILPALARQVGDLLEDDRGGHTVTPEGAAAVEDPQVINPARSRLRRRAYREPPPDRGAGPAPERGHRLEQRTYDPDALVERTLDHEACLRRIASRVVPPWTLHVGLYDLLAASGRKAVLVEVKTFRGDEARQVRIGLGQLLYYQHFDVEPDAAFRDCELDLLLAGDGGISQDLIGLLERHAVGFANFAADGRIEASGRGVRVLRALGIVATPLP